MLWGISKSTSKNNKRRKKSKDDKYLEDIQKVSSKIDAKEIFIHALANDTYNATFYRNCFDILSSEESFQKFLHYKDNLNQFGSNFTEEDYVINLSKILGTATDEMYFHNIVYDYSFVDYNMLDRYSKLRNLFNVDIKLLGDEPFGEEGLLAYHPRTQMLIDNDWQVNQELQDYIMKDIDSQTDLLEKIAQIYIKLCYALRYSNKYSIFEYGTGYYKERQEGISLEQNEVICSEFSKLCTNIFNKLDNQLEARCITTDTRGHEAVGILIRNRNIRINLEAININNYFNDLGRAKLGLPLKGIHYICDRNHEFKEAMDKAYAQFLQDKQITTEDFISAYEEISSDKTIEIDFVANLEAFLKRMQAKKVKGNELLNSFLYLNHLGYFGPIQYAFVGEDKKTTFTDRMKINTITEVLDGLEENILIYHQDNYYLLRLNALEYYPVTPEKINQLFQEDKMGYIDSKHTIEGIGMKR